MSRRAALATLATLAAIAGLYSLCARYLLHVDFMAQLLSPGTGAGLLLPALVLLLRLGSICLGPALLVSALFALAWPKPASARSTRGSTWRDQLRARPRDVAPK